MASTFRTLERAIVVLYIASNRIFSRENDNLYKLKY